MRTQAGNGARQRLQRRGGGRRAVAGRDPVVRPRRQAVEDLLGRARAEVVDDAAPVLPGGCGAPLFLGGRAGGLQFDLDPVVPPDRCELLGQLAGRRAPDGRVAVEAPARCRAAESPQQVVDGLQHLREVVAVEEDAAPAAAVAQRAGQQVGLRAAVPAGPGVGEVRPAEPDLLLVGVPAARPAAGGAGVAVPARRAQPVSAQGTGEGRVAAAVAEVGDLVEERGRRQVRVVRQAQAAVREEGEEDVLGRGAHPGLAVPGQVPPDGLAVPSEMPGDRRDRPSLAVEPPDIQVFVRAEQPKPPAYSLA
ncbi:hypothetical protein ACFQ1I_15160 [Kitasatospora arboriphila]